SVVLPLDLIVNEKPTIPAEASSPYLICESDATGYHQFDMSERDELVLAGRNAADYIIKYYRSEADAIFDTNPIAMHYTNEEAWDQEIWVRLEDKETGCYHTASFHLHIEERVFAHMPESLEYCDIDGVNDGSTEVDLTLLDDEIKLIQNIPNNQLGVNYYASEADYLNGTPIADPTSYITEVTPQTIIAEVYQIFLDEEGNVTAGLCRDTVSFEITVIDAPEMLDIADGFLCIDYRSGEATPYLMDTGLSESEYTFEWTINGQTIGGATHSYHEAIEAGVYTVTATSIATGCSSTQPITCESDPSSTIDIVHTTDGFSDTNAIEVVVSPNTYTYEYALDEGAYQLSNIFMDVSPGEHTVWVRVV